jgi:hypothetical protein
METELNIALLISLRKRDEAKKKYSEYDRLVDLATRLDDLNVLDSSYDLSTYRNW